MFKIFKISTLKLIQIIFSGLVFLIGCWFFILFLTMQLIWVSQFGVIQKLKFQWECMSLLDRVVRLLHRKQLLARYIHKFNFNKMLSWVYLILNCYFFIIYVGSQKTEIPLHEWLSWRLLFLFVSRRKKTI